jgi:hypothetical protein
MVLPAACGPAESASPPASIPGPTATSTPSPTATPTATPTLTPTPQPISLARRVEQRLDDLGYPTGTVDGRITDRTRQALCAWRETHGLAAGRAGLSDTLAESILAATAAPPADRPDGLYIDKTCQVLFQVVAGQYRRIVWVSTAAPGYRTPNGTGRVWDKWAGAHESSLYADAWMYDALYFLPNHPGIALHGSVSNALVHSYPASHGCVRVWRPDIQEIFRETPIGTPVTVYGAY